MHTLVMLGNILLGAFFIFMGIYNLKMRGHLHEKLKERGFHSIPDWLVILVVALQVIGGAALIFHYAAQIATIYLIAFTIVVTGLFHPFWKKGRDLWKDMIIVSYNVAIIGGLLLTLATRR